MGGSKLIAFECAAPTHRADASRADKLTIHEGRWAFCQFSAMAAGHVWKATGGEDVQVLLRRAGLHVGASGTEIDPAGAHTSR